MVLMPNRTIVKIILITREGNDVLASKAGENLCVKLQGIEEDEVSVGSILCSIWKPIPIVSIFEAHLAILDLFDHKSIFSAGYKCVLHIHSASEECEIIRIVYSINLKLKQKTKVKYVKTGEIIVAKISLLKPLCLETF